MSDTPSQKHPEVLEKTSVLWEDNEVIVCCYRFCKYCQKEGREVSSRFSAVTDELAASRPQELPWLHLGSELQCVFIHLLRVTSVLCGCGLPRLQVLTSAASSHVGSTSFPVTLSPHLLYVFLTTRPCRHVSCI
ncbi:unnamed protein product [Rangifer tarandus platyrhynchus]|uniref:Uncharacterized protein n=1 Tax=Rangifer tarandus platyrhynchus TaxID=3082113 RepID=A0ABN8ZQV7_RANTA|nr:unnamed protein product [Rangifer tarandus platyrhynchus]